MSEALNDGFSNRRQRFNRLLIYASLIGVAWTAVDVIDPNQPHRQTAADNIGKVLRGYDAGFAHTPQSENDAIDLESLSPLNIKALPTSGKLRVGAEIQTDAMYVSRTLLASGAYPAGQSDAYDVAGALIPSQTQTAMTNAGIEITPVAPVDCDVYDTYFNPYDYATSRPSDFNISVSNTGSSRITVPLGAAQQSELQDPFLPQNLLQPVDLSVIPCSEQPEPAHPPEALRQFLTY